METKIHKFDLIRRYLNQAVKNIVFIIKQKAHCER
ncbi:MAG: hypothetical protein ACI9YH_000921 [Colwellia sp.]|jgi:hypothetical protein